MANPIPATGLLRLAQIIGDPKAEPPVPPIIPVSKTSWWNGVKSGHYPQPVKLGPRTTAWRASDIRRIAEQGPDTASYGPTDMRPLIEAKAARRVASRQGEVA
ncbi:MAG: AlpA family phage regulatory protein [Candidatus Contendobacter sp.]|nr:AlpA family phage regulatory protein [Candidatus Contendobacter sp.]